MVNKLQNFSKRSANYTGMGRSAIVLALTALLLPACVNTTDREVITPEATTQTQSEVQPQAEAQPDVTVREVSENLAQLVGQTVTVRSNAEATNNPSAFRLNNNTLLGGEDVLVINASGTPFVLPENDDIKVQVTGEVRAFVASDLEREYNLGADYAVYENKPVIIAQSIALAPEPDELTENPQLYYGKPIAVEGKVENILGPNAFRIDDEEIFGSKDLLVLNTVANQRINDGQNVVVVGELRPFVAAEIERDYDLTWDAEVQRNIEAEYSKVPVFVAREVYPSTK